MLAPTRCTARCSTAAEACPGWRPPRRDGGRARSATKHRAAVTTLRSARANPPESAEDGAAACDRRDMSPIEQPPPAIWTAPVTPVRIAREFRPVAPYAPGGHRGIDLAASAGQPVRSPCDGVVVFRGAVAGGPPTLTVRCATLRATVQRVRPSVGRGATVDAGGVVGSATGAAIDLSARRDDGSYLDPASLLQRPERRIPPAVVRPRPASPTVRAQHPAQVADRALVTPNRGSEAAFRAGSARGAVRPAVDAPLGVVGAVAGGAALLALGLAAARRRRPGRRQPSRALPARVQR